VVVKVVDPGGAPHANVSLEFEYPQGDRIVTCGSARTDQAGFAHIELDAASMPEKVTARATVLGWTGAAPSVEIAVPQDRPAKLVLPPTGAIELRLIGPDGEPWPFLTLVWCRSRHWTMHAIGNGSARISAVHLGQTFTFSDRRAFPYGIEETVVAGPVLPGEAVRARIPVLCHRPLLTGRLLDPDGRPVADGTVTFHGVVQRDDGVFRGATDGHRATRCGRFLAHVREDTSYRTLRIQWWVEDRLVAWAEQPLCGRYSRSLHRLGAVRLSEASLLAAGRVRAADGGGSTKGVWIELHPDDGEGDLDDRPRRGEPRLAWVLGRDEDSRRFRRGRYHVRAAADGRFEIRGAPLRAPFTLVARSSRVAETRLTDIAPGANDLDVQMRRFGAVTGHLLTPRHLYPWDFELVITSPRGRRFESPRWHLHRDGSFEVKDIPPGRVNVAVHAKNGKRPIRLIPDVHVQSGQTSYDSRLNRIDLCGLAEVMTLRVVDPDRQPIAGAKVDTICSAAHDRPTDASGEAGFPTWAAPLTCIVSSFGFRSKRVTVTESAVVTLSRAIPLRINVACDGVSIGRLQPQVILRHEETVTGSDLDVTPSDVIRYVRRSRDFVDLYAETPGRHEVTVSISSPKGRGRRWIREITVKDQTTPQVFWIRLDPEEVRKALGQK